MLRFICFGLMVVGAFTIAFWVSYVAVQFLFPQAFTHNPLGDLPWRKREEQEDAKQG